MKSQVSIIKAFALSLVLVLSATQSLASEIKEDSCALKSKNPFGDLNDSVDKMVKGLVTVSACQVQEDGVAKGAELFANVKQIKESVNLLKPFHENPNAADLGDYEKAVNGFVDALQGLSSYMEKNPPSQNDCIRSAYNEGRFVLGLTQTIKSLTPYALVAFEALGIPGATALEPLLLSSVGLNTIVQFLSASGDYDKQIVTFEAREAFIDQTCLIVNLKKRYSSYSRKRQGDESEINKIIVDINEKIKAKKDSLKDQLDAASYEKVLRAEKASSIVRKVGKEKEALEYVKALTNISKSAGQGVGQGSGSGTIVMPTPGPVFNSPGFSQFSTQGLAENFLEAMTVEELENSLVEANDLPPAAGPGSTPFTGSENLLGGVTRRYQSSLSPQIMCENVGKVLVSERRQEDGVFPFSLIDLFSEFVSVVEEDYRGILQGHVNDFNRLVEVIRQEQDITKCDNYSKIFIDQNLTGIVSILDSLAPKLKEKTQSGIDSIKGYKKFTKELEDLKTEKKYREQERDVIEALREGQGTISVTEFQEKITYASRLYFLGPQSTKFGGLLNHFVMTDPKPMADHWLGYKLSNAERYLQQFEDSLDTFVARSNGPFGKALTKIANFLSHEKDEIRMIESLPKHIPESRRAEACNNIDLINEDFIKAVDELNAVQLMCDTLDPFLVNNEEIVDQELYNKCKDLPGIGSGSIGGQKARMSFVGERVSCDGRDNILQEKFQALKRLRVSLNCPSSIAIVEQCRENNL